MNDVGPRGEHVCHRTFTSDQALEIDDRSRQGELIHSIERITERRVGARPARRCRHPPAHRPEPGRVGKEEMADRVRNC